MPRKGGPAPLEGHKRKAAWVAFIGEGDVAQVDEVRDDFSKFRDSNRLSVVGKVGKADWTATGTNVPQNQGAAVGGGR